MPGLWFENLANRLWPFSGATPRLTCFRCTANSAGVSARLPYPIAVNVDLDHQLELNMLVDTGAPTTVIMLPKDVFDQLEKKAYPEQVKGLETTNKSANCIVYINEEKVGKVSLVRSGGSFAGYLNGQFSDCSGILGMDLLGKCNLSVCRGQVAIHFVPPAHAIT